jgi:cytochrome c551/c552
MKTKVLLALSLFVTMYTFGNPPVEEGKAIFSTRCAGCHNVNKTLTGPALAGVDQRRTIDWIINFVHSSQTVIKKGDKDAVALFEKFNKIPMPDHPDLTDENIRQIVDYIKSEAKTEASDAPPIARQEKLHPLYTPLTIQSHYGIFLTYLALVVVLVAVLVSLVKVKALQRQARGEE